jgi:hypothetical protein
MPRGVVSRVRSFRYEFDRLRAVGARSDAFLVEDFEKYFRE